LSIDLTLGIRARMATEFPSSQFKEGHFTQRPPLFDDRTTTTESVE